MSIELEVLLCLLSYLKAQYCIINTILLKLEFQCYAYKYYFNILGFFNVRLTLRVSYKYNINVNMMKIIWLYNHFFSSKNIFFFEQYRPCHATIEDVKKIWNSNCNCRNTNWIWWSLSVLHWEPREIRIWIRNPITPQHRTN